MSPTYCRPLPDRRGADWNEFYARGLPNILYRVHDPISHSKLVPDRGFLPSSGVTRRAYNQFALHHAAVEHGVGWVRRAPSPFVSLSCSFGYTVWEACRRYTTKRSLKDTVIWFIDRRTLMRRRPGRRHLFHAVDLIDESGTCSPAKRCTPDCDAAARFASAADEVLVFGSVPAEAIIGSISFEDLVTRLPVYFFNPAAEIIPPPKRDAESFLEGFSKSTYRDAYDALIDRLATLRSAFNPTWHAEAAFELATSVYGSSWRSGPHTIHDVELIANDVANWIIDWKRIKNSAGNGQIPPGIDVTWYIMDYISFRTIMLVGDDDVEPDALNHPSPVESVSKLPTLPEPHTGSIMKNDSLSDPYRVLSLSLSTVLSRNIAKDEVMDEYSDDADILELRRFFGFTSYDNTTN